MATKQAIEAFLKEDFPQCPCIIDEVGDQQALVRQQVGFDHLRPGDTLSGPTMMGLADFALYVAVLGEIGIVPLAVTTNLNINFLRKPKAHSDLMARCRLLKVGRSLAMGEVYLFSDGSEDEVIAHVTGTYAIPPKR